MGLSSSSLCDLRQSTEFLCLLLSYWFPVLAKLTWESLVFLLPLMGHPVLSILFWKRLQSLLNLSLFQCILYSAVRIILLKYKSDHITCLCLKASVVSSLPSGQSPSSLALWSGPSPPLSPYFSGCVVHPHSCLSLDAADGLLFSEHKQQAHLPGTSFFLFSTWQNLLRSVISSGSCPKSWRRVCVHLSPPLDCGADEGGPTSALLCLVNFIPCVVLAHGRCSTVAWVENKWREEEKFQVEITVFILCYHPRLLVAWTWDNIYWRTEK